VVSDVPVTIRQKRKSVKRYTGLVLKDALTTLARIQDRLLWLATYAVHHANNLRPAADATKVGGHQASSSSVVSLLTALYFAALRPEDIVAVKAHAAPAFYAAQYLRGRLSVAALQGLREFGGLQAYPSRRKNPDVVDLTTGSMGLGAVAATFGALAGRYLLDHPAAFPNARPPGRYVVMVGDAELDEGNVWEALGEEPLGRLDNVLWIVDLNRQSLDRVIPEGRGAHLRRLFDAFGWHVVELQHGARRRRFFGRSGGERLRARLEAMPAAEFHGLLRSPASRVRKALVAPPGGEPDPALERLLSRLADEEIASLVADVGGHDLETILAALEEARAHASGPCVILAHTIKGWGLPLAADVLNHTALLTSAQIDELRARLGIAPGEEWAGFAPGTAEARWIAELPPLWTPPPPPPDPPEVPDELGESYPDQTSTQEAFGRVLGALARRPTGDAIVTVSADVAVTTHLAGWINRRGVYFPGARRTTPDEAPSPVRWHEGPAGQHIELGIAEHDLFLLLGALGLGRDHAGAAVAAIGTLYDPFVTRGLDALYHALYAGGRFIVVATPSGVSLAPEGGAHQSVITPGIGITLPGITYFEPAFAREVEWILLEALTGVLTGRGESCYLRLSTAPLDQRAAPPSSPAYRAAVLAGGYRLVDARGQPGYDPEVNAVQLFATGVMVPEALSAARQLGDVGVHASVFVVTSADRLYRSLRDRRPYLEKLVGADEEGVPIVSVVDGHSHALAFLGSALGVAQLSLGVDDFGQSGTRRALYAHYGIDAAAIARAARRLLG
jgi:pyruvate dehydrogenase E1 component